MVFSCWVDSSKKYFSAVAYNLSYTVAFAVAYEFLELSIGVFSIKQPYPETRTESNFILFCCAYWQLSWLSQVPVDRPRALQPAEQAQSPKKHRNPASLKLTRLRPIMAKNKTFILSKLQSRTEREMWLNTICVKCSVLLVSRQLIPIITFQKKNLRNFDKKSILQI